MLFLFIEGIFTKLVLIILSKKGISETKKNQKGSSDLIYLED